MKKFILYVVIFCTCTQGVFTQGHSASNKTNNNSKLKKMGSEPMKRVWLHFTTFLDVTLTREILLGFSSSTTDNYDYGYEAEINKLEEHDLGSILDGKIMGIQAFSDITNEKSVPLFYKSCGLYAHEIKLSRTQNISSNQEIYLKDNLTETCIDLTQETAYQFTSIPGEFYNRFEIVFKKDELTLAIGEFRNKNQYIYYENSTNKLFSKNCNANTCEITFINMLDQTLLKLNNISQQELSKGLTISKLPSGTYIIKAKTDDHQVITKKIIVY